MTNSRNFSGIAVLPLSLTLSSNLRALRDIDTTMIPTIYGARAARDDAQMRASAFRCTIYPIPIKIRPLSIIVRWQDGLQQALNILSKILPRAQSLGTTQPLGDGGSHSQIGSRESTIRLMSYLNDVLYLVSDCMYLFSDAHSVRIKPSF
jgi:hypothetical protein